MLGHFFGWGFIVQVLAIAHWAKRGRDRFWIWIIIFGGVVGALAYFLIEGLPDWDDMKRSMRGPSRRRRIETLRAMIHDNPSAGNYEELGALLVEERKWRDAREAFDRAIAQRTDLLDTFYWRGVAAFELGDDKAAIADLEKVAKVHPKYDYSRVQCFLARALARSVRTQEAMAAFERLIEISTSSESIVTAAEFFAANGREAQARELVDTILARRATMPAYQKRRDRTWISLAKKLDRKLAA